MPVKILYILWYGFLLWAAGSLLNRAMAGPELADEVALQQNIDPVLLKAVCSVESSWQNVSGDGGESIGLCQLNPETVLDTLYAKSWKAAYTRQERIEAVRKILWNKRANLTLAAMLLNHYIKKYDGDVTMALMAYNGGTRHPLVRYVEKVKERGKI